MVMVDVPDQSVAADALADLHRARRHRRLAGWNVIDALYKAYVAALVAGGAALALSGVVGDDRLGPSAVAGVVRRGPGAFGVAVGLAVALGLRSGSLGGPLALEAAEVRHVLLAPIERRYALRGPAVKQLRFGAFAGGAIGGVAGLVAFRRLPGTPGYWVLAVAVAGALAGVLAMGAGLVAAGQRWPKPLALLAGLLATAWPAADAATGRITSPLSLVGALAEWPLRFRPLGAGGLVIAAFVALAGVAAIGGLSLEAAERRGRLVTHLRFAATLQDIRTVLLLRQQLAQERPRSRPWVRIGRRRATKYPVWRRDWQGIARWPAVRLVRLAVFGVAAGLAMVGVWAGTSPLVVVAGVALFAAGLDAIEGLNQDLDHPDRRDSFPVPTGNLDLRHLVAPIVTVSVVNLIAVGVAAAFDPVRAALVGLPLAIPAAITAVGGAAVNSLRQPANPQTMMMDATGMVQVYRIGWPPFLSSVGPLMVLAVRSGQPAGAAAVIVTAVGVLVLGWVRQREAIGGMFAGGGMSAVGRT